jgi:hypothetical protein
MAGDDFTLKVRRFKPRDRRLGRHVVHDSRSLRFLAPAKDPKTLASARHTINIPILDQGNVGSCTGHAATAALGGNALWRAGSTVLTPDATQAHEYAVGIYSDATALDPWPGQYVPDDTGSDGLSVAKVLQQRGLISGYTHATSLDAALAALADAPVIVGTNWLRGMFDPRQDGQVVVSGPIDGGHEYCLDEIDVENKVAWIRQSWGPTWGLSGRAWLTWADLGKLLADDGDCTVFVPRSEPPPVPAPVPPKPSLSAEDKALASSLHRWMHTSAGPSYLRKDAQAWLSSKESPP